MRRGHFRRRRLRELFIVQFARRSHGREGRNRGNGDHHRRVRPDCPRHFQSFGNAGVPLRGYPTCPAVGMLRGLGYGRVAQLYH